MKRDEDGYINDEMVEEGDKEKELPNALWRNEKTDNEISKLTNYMVLFMCFIVPIPFGILAGVYLLGRNEKEIRELGAACIQTSFIAVVIWMLIIIRIAVYFYYALQGTIEFDLTYGEETYNIIISNGKITVS